jgi:hypothetical protein
MTQPSDEYKHVRAPLRQAHLSTSTTSLLLLDFTPVSIHTAHQLLRIHAD